MNQLECQTATQPFHVHGRPHDAKAYLNPDGASNSCVDILVLAVARSSPESGPVKGTELRYLFTGTSHGRDVICSSSRLVFSKADGYSR